jgi:hypothetical protein
MRIFVLTATYELRVSRKSHFNFNRNQMEIAKYLKMNGYLRTHMCTESLQKCKYDTKV